MKKLLPFLLVQFVAFLTLSQDVSVVGENIESIRAQIYSDFDGQNGKPFEGYTFRVNVFATLEDGRIIESLALDTLQNKDDYEIEIDGATVFGTRLKTNSGQNKTKWNCGPCTNGFGTKILVKVKRKEDQNWLLEQEFDVICKGELEDIEARALAEAKRIQEENDKRDKVEDPFSYEFRTAYSREKRLFVIKNKDSFPKDKHHMLRTAIEKLPDAEERAELLAIFEE